MKYFSPGVLEELDALGVCWSDVNPMGNRSSAEGMEVEGAGASPGTGAALAFFFRGCLFFFPCDPVEPAAEVLAGATSSTAVSSGAPEELTAD
jgi:hypothetical protein